MTGARDLPFDRIGADGARGAIVRPVAIETPVAIAFNGIGYAVMMASPVDLDDFAVGFARGERLIERARDVLSIDRVERPQGELLRVNLAPECATRVVDRVRHRVSESSCGLCGIENLEQALRPLPRVAAQSATDEAAVFRALGELRSRQPLNAATGAVHAAAQCAADGSIVRVREDVGRHNAFDKLIGAMLRECAKWDGGFALLSARCSYELVEKAVLSGCPMLATISAPTTLAVARAAEAGLRLIVLARSDAILESP
ncbi:MAG: formate dehydrogenase accessory sulfurtransferase FdhD [Sphingomonadaceae bacterium]|nr:formate dehydrogenase accessory sulfurtransferase FdhD [Sphingomonadaceae bacterium]